MQRLYTRLRLRASARRLALALGGALLFAGSLRAGEPVRVACIGDSITYGYGLADRENQSYPAQLQALLGDGYRVGNFGRNGTTLLRRGHRPYIDQPEFAAALSFGADIYVIHLGVNDTDPRDWPDYRDDFVGDYLALMDTLRSANPGARFYIAAITPIGDRHPRFQSGTKEWQDEIREQIRTVAEISGAYLLDFHRPLYPYPQHLPDAIHPDAFACGLLARTVYSALTGDFGGLRLSILYSDHMVFQREEPLVVRGTANAGERVRVALGKEQRLVTADGHGRWSADFGPRPAATGLELRVSAPSGQYRFRDVAIGEVWLCSGQSNMAFRMEEMGEALDEAGDADLRLFDMKPRWVTDNVTWPEEALRDLDRLDYFEPAAWQAADPESIRRFSAIAYCFGKTLRDSLQVPVGLICNAVGGATTESWVDRQRLETQFPQLLSRWLDNDFIQEWARGRARTNLGGGDELSRHPYQPCYLFEAGILPLEAFPVRGVIWYQGESNAHNVSAHERLFPMLVDSWRTFWGKPAMPFLYVQLSSINRPSWPWFRDSQRRLLDSRPALGMAVSSDLGDPWNVHPVRKRPVAERLARLALHDVYGRRDVVPSGPLPLDAFLRADGKVEIRFEWGDGLHAPGDEALRGFELAAREGCFFPAETAVEGSSIVLTPPAGLEGNPATLVRYGWEPYSTANLYNDAGLPASTFRTIVKAFL